MSNFYTDNEDILFHLENTELDQVVNLREDGYSDKDKFSYAPKNLDDAVSNYKHILEVLGDICGNFIAPRAPEVDEVSAVFKDGEVHYAKGTVEALEQLKKSDFMGLTIPRRYGGINLPKVVYSMCIEMVSRADASLMNLVGLQDIAETIYKFGNEEQRENYLPRFCKGEVMGSMALTEPDAGSDLQAVMLKAINEGDDWYLNGSKRFITNGCADVSLVLARSEEGSRDGRGLSLFVYERDKNMIIRRIEHKLGIHGSPTCEIQFNKAKAELLGRRRMGLIKYTMSLMNGARLGIGAQSLGIAEAAYREAYKYANERVQFKKNIKEFSAVYEMLTEMKVGLEAGRALLYETSRIVDVKEGIEEIIDVDSSKKADHKAELAKYTKLAALFTPLLKAYNTEMGNKVCYDALQIHGGVGFTTEFNVERHTRDVRITNIYEGTTQLQVVAAIGGVMSGLAVQYLDEFATHHKIGDLPEFKKIKKMRDDLDKAVGHVKSKDDKVISEYHARRLVEMAEDAILSYLFLRDSKKNERKKSVMEVFTSKAVHRVESTLNYILSDDYSVIELHKNIID